jgi:hypothetical protein
MFFSLPPSALRLSETQFHSCYSAFLRTLMFGVSSLALAEEVTTSFLLSELRDWQFVGLSQV